MDGFSTVGARGSRRPRDEPKYRDPDRTLAGYGTRHQQFRGTEQEYNDRD